MSGAYLAQNTTTKDVAIKFQIQLGGYLLKVLAQFRELLDLQDLLRD